MMWIYFQIKRLSKCALKRVACPTLVLCGRQDALTPVALYEEMAAGIRGAKLVVERSGHLSPLGNPMSSARPYGAGSPNRCRTGGSAKLRRGSALKRWRGASLARPAQEEASTRPHPPSAVTPIAQTKIGR